MYSALVSTQSTWGWSRCRGKMAAVAKAMERARRPAPAAPVNHEDVTRMVFFNMAGRRLLPKECWSLSRILHDTVAPTIKVHLVADSTNSAVLHRLLEDTSMFEDTSRRRIRCLALDGDFTSMQQCPLSLPPSLERLELNGFKGELGAAPSGLRELYLCAFFERGTDDVPHPLLVKYYDPLVEVCDPGALYDFVGEMTEIVKAFLPTLQVLHVHGPTFSNQISISMLVKRLAETPHSRLQVLSLRSWAVPWEALLLLLSPALAQVKLEYCNAIVDDDSLEYTLPLLPEGLVSLDLVNCESDSYLWVFRRLPESLRHLGVEMDSTTSIRFEAPLPTLLESFRAETLESGIEIDMDLLPGSLHKLELVGAEQQPLDRVPAGLRVLMLRNYRHPLPQLPDTLEALVVDKCTHHVIDLPDSLRSLPCIGALPFRRRRCQPAGLRI
eukprot:TRINITY_DN1471_c0_g5_i2.p1 TRINITY_DN1471_c0_g5~~TRINITY_DN1471_c0_g5_i2.p1  ORF type:complete len:441 (+),score=48.74 TRINITY_DN1471_c0_g5_i2:1601-2923(+)